jgi:hypothetical protein
VGLTEPIVFDFFVLKKRPKCPSDVEKMRDSILDVPANEWGKTAQDPLRVMLVL